MADDALVLLSPSSSVEDVLAAAIRCVNAGDRTRARQLCEQLVATRPPHPAVQQLLAVIELQNGDCAAAATLASASLALRPGHTPTLRVAADAWFRLSLARHAQGDAEGEMQALREVLRVAPQHAEAEVNLGLALQERGALDEAMRAYGRAYRLREDSFGRIAHALASVSTGRLWLNLDGLRNTLRNTPP
ncbi:MAG TPA: tetratricopeptide repeat protein [Burkholderiaceae bacterium]|nr:tetratricopeptide repeat protein [Burkholderiaceae bacterium]